MTHSIKNEIIKLIKSLPEDITFEEAMYHLYIKETITNRIKEIEGGTVKLIPEQEVKEMFKKWLK